MALAAAATGRCGASSIARADGWDERTGAGSVDHLAPLAAAAAHVDRPRPSGPSTSAPEPARRALFLAREFPRASVRGVDISEEMIRAAQAKVGLDPDGRVAFRVARRRRPALRRRSFDLVTQLNMPPVLRRDRPRAAPRRPRRSSPPARARRRPSTPRRPCSSAAFAAAGIEPVGSRRGGRRHLLRRPRAARVG